MLFVISKMLSALELKSKTAENSDVSVTDPLETEAEEAELMEERYSLTSFVLHSEPFFSVGLASSSF